jgi:hypothetical protein
MNINQIYNQTLITTGDGRYKEVYFPLSDATNNATDEVIVMNVMAQISPYDILAMNGKIKHTNLSYGNGGIGVVISRNDQYKPIDRDDDLYYGALVSTFGVPAFADYYNVSRVNAVKIHDLHPRYILYPVACAIYMVNLHIDFLRQFDNQNKRILIIGSGFLAKVINSVLRYYRVKYNIRVYGHYLKQYKPMKVSRSIVGKFDIIFDLSDRNEIDVTECFTPNALIVLAHDKELTTIPSSVVVSNVDCTNVSPSIFKQSMTQAERYITRGIIDVDDMWTHEYNRYSAWENAFSEAANRSIDHRRSYLYWKGLNEREIFCGD